MSIKEEIEKDFREAMLANDELRKVTFRLALSAMKLAEVEKRAPLDDNEVITILNKEVKSRRETIQDAHLAGRDDLADIAEAEIAILVDYLPRPLTDAELEGLVLSAIAEVGAQSLADMGMVMKVLMPRVNNRAAGGQVSSMVKEKLSA